MCEYTHLLHRIGLIHFSRRYQTSRTDASQRITERSKYYAVMGLSSTAKVCTRGGMDKFHSCHPLSIQSILSLNSVVPIYHLSQCRHVTFYSRTLQRSFPRRYFMLIRIATHRFQLLRMLLCIRLISHE